MDGDEGVGPGTVTFYWKVSSDYGDCLEFYIDDVLKDDIDGTVVWTQSPAYEIQGAGTHTLRWRYVKDGDGSGGSDCGWVDYIQWIGFTPTEPPGTWETLGYSYDYEGRRSEKKYDNQTVLTYVYACPELAERDGDHCIAEYDGNGVLQRKYIYGPGVDEPICMIEEAGTYEGTYYYHFDALGSVVALSNAAGNTVQAYDYSVWGQVGASDPNHTNPYLFTARRFDKETGLYYYRARYYNPEIGRFLQTDPVGYDAGMNLYRYCSNNPWNRVDPFGLDDSNDPNVEDERCSWCTSNVDRQVTECKKRVMSRMKPLRKQVTKDKTALRLVYGAACFDLMLISRIAGTLCFQGLAAAIEWYGYTATAKLDDVQSKSLDYCDQMGAWCRGSRDGRPDWVNKQWVDGSGGLHTISRPWAREGGMCNSRQTVEEAQ